MLFDQFNHEIAPGETRAIKEFMPDGKSERFHSAACDHV